MARRNQRNFTHNPINNNKNYRYQKIGKESHLFENEKKEGPSKVNKKEKNQKNELQNEVQR